MYAAQDLIRMELPVAESAVYSFGSATIAALCQLYGSESEL